MDEYKSLLDTDLEKFWNTLKNVILDDVDAPDRLKIFNECVIVLKELSKLVRYTSTDHFKHRSWDVIRYEMSKAKSLFYKLSIIVQNNEIPDYAFKNLHYILSDKNHSVEDMFDRVSYTTRTFNSFIGLESFILELIDYLERDINQFVNKFVRKKIREIVLSK